MEILQEILVLITFLIALGYMVTRFIWKPSFPGGSKKKDNTACGVSGCGCSD